jgi:hypothetical protein
MRMARKITQHGSQSSSDGHKNSIGNTPEIALQKSFAHKRIFRLDPVFPPRSDCFGLDQR